MITNKGKDVIAKFLIGQAPAYASHIAFGAGPTPLATGQALGDYSSKYALDFEMFRTQITSRGYVTDLVYNELTEQYDEVSKVVFTAEIPSEQRYEISEIGVYSAKSDPTMGNRSARILNTFTENESWEYHDDTTAVSLGGVVSVPLYGNSNDGIIKPEELGRTNPAFVISSDNALFDATARKSIYEKCRYLGSNIMVNGTMSSLEVVNSVMSHKVTDEDGYYGSHIHLAGISLDLSKNAPDDELKLAFSVVSKDQSYMEQPSRVMILLEFSSDDTKSATNYAKFQVDLGPANWATNRYRVVTKKISELIKSPDFTWNGATLLKVYVSVFENNETTANVEQLSSNFYVCLDAFRLENAEPVNPLYGLTGYSVVKTSDGQPMPKLANSSNLVEFRFGLDVV